MPAGIEVLIFPLKKERKKQLVERLQRIMPAQPFLSLFSKERRSPGFQTAFSYNMPGGLEGERVSAYALTE